MTYTISQHFPGCLPDGEVETAETWDGAIAALASMVDLSWDAEYGWEDTPEWRDACDARWLPVHSAINTLPRDRAVSLYVEGPTPTHSGFYFSIDGDE